MFRLPLWDIVRINSHQFGDFQAKNIPVLDLHEIATGKLAALFSRKQTRDLFDVHQILQMDNIDYHKLRIGFVVYGAMNRKDWRTISMDDIAFDDTELSRQLLPMLRPDRTSSQINEYGSRLVKECRDKISFILPFANNELEFLNYLLDKGIIKSELITDDPDLQHRIQNQPLLEWKALHVKKHKGLSK